LFFADNAGQQWSAPSTGWAIEESKGSRDGSTITVEFEVFVFLNDIYTPIDFIAYGWQFQIAPAFLNQGEGSLPFVRIYNRDGVLRWQGGYDDTKPFTLTLSDARATITVPQGTFGDPVDITTPSDNPCGFSMSQGNLSLPVPEDSIGIIWATPFQKS
jgi:hypothetical protein